MCIFFLHFKCQYLWHKEYIETYLNQPNQQLRSSYLRLPSQRKNPNKFDSPSRIKLVRIFPSTTILLFQPLFYLYIKLSLRHLNSFTGLSFNHFVRNAHLFCNSIWRFNLLNQAAYSLITKFKNININRCESRSSHFGDQNIIKTDNRNVFRN